MPFTFCHPAIVLPLNKLSKRYFSLTSLIIGSLTPDFEYFVRMRIKSNFSHSIDGIFYFDLPLGIVLCFIFHIIIRDKIIENAPLLLKRKIISFKMFNWIEYFKTNYLLVVISLLIGITSHIIWDDFTHKSGFFVNKIPLLRTNILNVPIYKVLQHTSSLLGGIFLLFSIYNLKNEEVLLNKKQAIPFWTANLLVTLGLFSLRFFTSLKINQYGNQIVSLIASFMISLILTSIYFKKRH